MGRLLRMILKYFSLTLSSFLFFATASSAQTLKTVQERGYLLCGVSEGLPGFSVSDDKGQWSGLDVDFCRAVAAAIFNDVNKTKFVPLSTNERFGALQTKKVDVLARNSTWTMERDTGLGIIFAAVNYYDGQGFMVRKTLKIDSALELAGKSICTLSGTTTELNLADYFGNNRLTFTVNKFSTADEALKAYETKQCDALTSDISQLHAQRSKLSSAIDHIVLPEVISKEPLGPAVRQDDFQWLSIIKWTHFAMVNAEELGVGLKTIDAAMNSQKPDIRRLLGLEGNFGEKLGLTKDWAAHAIRSVGNYGEVFERNLGTMSKLAIARGLNNLWDRGGIQYAPPIR
jgi:general L-amino acid transport system substrate-binding protein